MTNVNQLGLKNDEYTTVAMIGRQRKRQAWESDDNYTSSKGERVMCYPQISDMGDQMYVALIKQNKKYKTKIWFGEEITSSV